MSRAVTRCGWCGADPIYVRYHDQEWGVPVHDDRTLFEFLILEGAQAGLSWITILRKREAYREAFAGFEVIYTGLHQTPAMVAEAAVQEDVDAIGLSLLSGAHLTLFPAILEELRRRGGGDKTVFGGGIIPDEDVPALTDAGVAKIFTPGASTHEIVDWIRGNVRPRA